LLVSTCSFENNVTHKLGTLPDIKPYAKVFSAAEVILAKSPPRDLHTYCASFHVAVGFMKAKKQDPLNSFHPGGHRATEKPETK